MIFIKYLLGLIFAWFLVRIILRTYKNLKGEKRKEEILQEVAEFNFDGLDKSILDHYNEAKNNKNLLAFGPVLSLSGLMFKSLSKDSGLNKISKWNSRYWDDIEINDTEKVTYFNNFFNSINEKTQELFNTTSPHKYIEYYDEINSAIEKNIAKIVESILKQEGDKDKILIGLWPDGDVLPEDYKRIKNMNEPRVFELLKVEKEENIKAVEERINNGKENDYSHVFANIEAKVEQDLSIPELSANLKIGIDKGFEAFKEMVGDEKIYTFGLYTSSEYSWIEVVGNTEEAKEAKISLELENPENEMSEDEIKNYCKWGFGDWKYSFKIENDELKQVGEILGKSTKLPLE